MSKVNFYHALKIDKSKCIGCLNCLKSCPTEAIRIRNGKAIIKSGRCVDCGECLRSCPHKAVYVSQDDLSKIYDYKYRVALFPSVLIAQFPSKISGSTIYGHLADIGFTHMFEVEQPIGHLHNELSAFFKEDGHEKPYISSYCPSVVRLIQVKYPEFTDNLIPIRTPYALGAHHVKQKLKREGIPEDEIGLFYITPCASKMAAVQTPVGEYSSAVDGTIAMSEIYNRVMAGDADGREVNIPTFGNELTKEGILWTLPTGEASNFKDISSISVDGMKNVVRFMDMIESQEIRKIDFLEFRACEEGCAGGICVIENRFITSRRLRDRAEKYGSFRDKDISKYDKPNLRLDEPILPRPMVKLDEDWEKAIKKMEHSREVLKLLPGIDCGVCGAPSCVALSQDIVRGHSKLTDCFFIQSKWQADGRLTPQSGLYRVEKTWGKDRVEEGKYKDE